MNDITLIGILPKRVSYHFTEGGRDLIRFTLRTGNSGKSQDKGASQNKSPAIDHHCQAWGPAAIDLHTNLKPGDRVMIRGELQYRNHRNRRGELQRFAEIHVRGYTYLGTQSPLTFRPRLPKRKVEANFPAGE